MKIITTTVNNRINSHLDKLQYDSKQIAFCIKHNLPIIPFDLTTDMYMPFIDTINKLLADKKKCYLVLSKYNYILDCTEYYFLYERLENTAETRHKRNFRDIGELFGVNRYEADCYKYCADDRVVNKYCNIRIVDGNVM